MTQMDLNQQDTAAQLLREGARLLYTVAAGQFFELGDVNAWFERFNALATQFTDEDLGGTYGAIGARTSESDPLIDQAAAALADLAQRVSVARDDFDTAVANARQSGGA